MTSTTRRRRDLDQVRMIWGKEQARCWCNHSPWREPWGGWAEDHMWCGDSSQTTVVSVFSGGEGTGDFGHHFCLSPWISHSLSNTCTREHGEAVQSRGRSCPQPHHAVLGSAGAWRVGKQKQTWSFQQKSPWECVSSQLPCFIHLWWQKILLVTDKMLWGKKLCKSWLQKKNAEKNVSNSNKEN